MVTLTQHPHRFTIDELAMFEEKYREGGNRGAGGAIAQFNYADAKDYSHTVTRCTAVGGMYLMGVCWNARRLHIFAISTQEPVSMDTITP